MKGFNGLPSWAKGTVVVAGTLTAIVGGFFLIRAVSKTIQGIKAGSDGRTIGGDLKELNKDTETRQTISDSQAVGFANRIFVAMDGNGTDENAILDVFTNVKNDADVLAIIKAFGTKKLTNSLLWSEVVYQGGLAGAIQDELDAGDINKLNMSLEKKGIKYKF
jgi:hypothetical protein